MTIDLAILKSKAGVNWYETHIHRMRCGPIAIETEGKGFIPVKENCSRSPGLILSIL